MPVLLEGSLVVELIRRGVNLDFNPEAFQAGHILGVEIRHAARRERNVAHPRPGWCESRSLMADEVELFVEGLADKGDRPVVRPRGVTYSVTFHH